MVSLKLGVKTILTYHYFLKMEKSAQTVVDTIIRREVFLTQILLNFNAISVKSAVIGLEENRI